MKFPELELGLRGTAKNMVRTIELAEYPNAVEAPVCQFVADNREDVDQEALARLFIAAPDMLEALKFLMSHVNHCRSTFSLASGRQGAFEATFDKMSAYIENIDALTGKIEAAIAKAEGK